MNKEDKKVIRIRKAELKKLIARELENYKSNNTQHREIEVGREELKRILTDELTILFKKIAGESEVDETKRLPPTEIARRKKERSKATKQRQRDNDRLAKKARDKYNSIGMSNK